MMKKLWMFVFVSIRHEFDNSENNEVTIYIRGFFKITHIIRPGCQKELFDHDNT